MAELRLLKKPGSTHYERFWERCLIALPRNVELRAEKLRAVVREICPDISDNTLNVYYTTLMAIAVTEETVPRLTRLRAGTYILISEPGSGCSVIQETPVTQVARVLSQSRSGPPPGFKRQPPIERWQRQDQFADESNPRKGNCVQAALASLLGLRLTEVPNFVFEHGGQWFGAFRAWLDSRGFDVMRVDPRCTFTGYYLVVGESPRGTIHMVVYRDGVLHHDPHPSDGGLRAGSIREVYVLLPQDPSKVLR